MSRGCNVRVEAKDGINSADPKERERAFRSMFSAFKRQVNTLGVLTEYNQKQSYESRSQKRRRKMKEAELRRQREEFQSRLREHFGQG